MLSVQVCTVKSRAGICQSLSPHKEMSSSLPACYTVSDNSNWRRSHDQSISVGALNQTDLPSECWARTVERQHGMLQSYGFAVFTSPREIRRSPIYHGLFWLFFQTPWVYFCTLGGPRYFLARARKFTGISQLLLKDKFPKINRTYLIA